MQIHEQYYNIFIRFNMKILHTQLINKIIKKLTTVLVLIL